MVYVQSGAPSGLPVGIITQCRAEIQPQELDELCTFICRKVDKCWIWIALCRETRQVVAYYLGKREEAACRALWERIPPAYRAHCRCYTDLWAAYAAVLPSSPA